MKTDKELLVKGLKHLIIAALLMFAGPTLLYFVMGNAESRTYYPLLIIGILICMTAIYCGFRGIRIIMDGIFR